MNENASKNSETSLSLATKFSISFFDEYDNEYVIVRMETTSGEASSTVSELGYDENGYQNYQKIVAQSGMVQEFFLINDELGRVVEQRELVTCKNTANETVSKYEYTDSNGSFVT